jgi:3-dehydroquinate dehydratase
MDCFGNLPGGRAKVSFVADIATNAANEGVRAAAVAALTDQTVLTDIARNDRTPQVRLAATQKLNDRAVAEAVHAHLAKDDGRSAVHSRAVSHYAAALRDEILRGNGALEVRLSAVAA